MTDDFSAAASALGYAYQCEVALLEFLRRDDPSLELSLELLDDIGFEGSELELLQAKYHISPGSLTDGSVELWKTLRVWSEADVVSGAAILTLVTTATAAPGSIASLLRHDDDRNPERAHDRLVAHARSATGAALEKARKAFLGLSDDRRKAMVERIVVCDNQAHIDDLDGAFAIVLRHAAPRDRRAALVARLREWWLLRAEQHLVGVATGGAFRISGVEIEDRIADLRDQLAVDNLPIDMENIAAPTDEHVLADQRAFVMQLRLIALANARIRNAIHDYNRAFAQRARWVRDLVAVGELEQYERRLKEEWERLWLPDTDEIEALSEEDARARGRAVHRACEDTTVPLRPKVAAPYVLRGSLQMLADELRIGWHPNWVARMQQVLTEAGHDEPSDD